MGLYLNYHVEPQTSVNPAPYLYLRDTWAPAVPVRKSAAATGDSGAFMCDGGVSAAVHGRWARQREDPGVQTGVLLQRGAACGSGAAAEERRRRLQAAAPRGQHQGLPLGQGGEIHPQNVSRVRHRQRLWVRRAWEVQGVLQRRLRGPLHLLAPDVRHRGPVTGHRVARQQRSLQGGDPGVRVHPSTQRARSAHQGGGEETHPGIPQGNFSCEVIM